MSNSPLRGRNPYDECNTAVVPCQDPVHSSNANVNVGSHTPKWKPPAVPAGYPARIRVADGISIRAVDEPLTSLLRALIIFVEKI